MKRDFCMNALWTFPHLQAYVDFGLILYSSSKNVLHTTKNQNTEARMTQWSLNSLPFFFFFFGHLQPLSSFKTYFLQGDFNLAETYERGREQLLDLCLCEYYQLHLGSIKIISRGPSC